MPTQTLSLISQYTTLESNIGQLRQQMPLQTENNGLKSLMDACLSTLETCNNSIYDASFPTATEEKLNEIALQLTRCQRTYQDLVKAITDSADKTLVAELQNFKASQNAELTYHHGYKTDLVLQKAIEALDAHKSTFSNTVETPFILALLKNKTPEQIEQINTTTKTQWQAYNTTYEQLQEAVVSRIEQLDTARTNYLQMYARKEQLESCAQQWKDDVIWTQAENAALKQKTLTFRIKKTIGVTEETSSEVTVSQKEIDKLTKRITALNEFPKEPEILTDNYYIEMQKHKSDLWGKNQVLLSQMTTELNIDVPAPVPVELTKQVDATINEEKQAQKQIQQLKKTINTQKELLAKNLQNTTAIQKNHTGNTLETLLEQLRTQNTLLTQEITATKQRIAQQMLRFKELKVAYHFSEAEEQQLTLPEIDTTRHYFDFQGLNQQLLQLQQQENTLNTVVKRFDALRRPHDEIKTQKAEFLLTPITLSTIDAGSLGLLLTRMQAYASKEQEKEELLLHLDSSLAQAMDLKPGVVETIDAFIKTLKEEKNKNIESISKKIEFIQLMSKINPQWPGYWFYRSRPPIVTATLLLNQLQQTENIHTLMNGKEIVYCNEIHCEGLHLLLQNIKNKQGDQVITSGYFTDFIKEYLKTRPNITLDFNKVLQAYVDKGDDLLADKGYKLLWSLRTFKAFPTLYDKEGELPFETAIPDCMHFFDTYFDKINDEEANQAIIHKTQTASAYKTTWKNLAILVKPEEKPVQLTTAQKTKNLLINVLGLVGLALGIALTLTGVLAPLGIAVFGISALVTSTIIFGAAGLTGGALLGLAAGKIVDAVVPPPLVEQPLTPPLPVQSTQPEQAPKTASFTLLQGLHPKSKTPTPPEVKAANGTESNKNPNP